MESNSPLSCGGDSGYSQSYPFSGWKMPFIINPPRITIVKGRCTDKSHFHRIILPNAFPPNVKRPIWRDGPFVYLDNLLPVSGADFLFLSFFCTLFREHFPHAAKELFSAPDCGCTFWRYVLIKHLTADSSIPVRFYLIITPLFSKQIFSKGYRTRYSSPKHGL